MVSPRRAVEELLTMLEGFKREPEEDDGVEEAVQTMRPEDLQKMGRKMEGREAKGGWGDGDGRRFQEGDRKKKQHEKGVWGAPAYPVTHDLSSLCQPSAGLSGGFVGASTLNGHPADRHAVYPLCVCYGRETEAAQSVCTQRRIQEIERKSRIFNCIEKDLSLSVCKYEGFLFLRFISPQTSPCPISSWCGNKWQSLKQAEIPIETHTGDWQAWQRLDCFHGN